MQYLDRLSPTFATRLRLSIVALTALVTAYGSTVSRADFILVGDTAPAPGTFMDNGSDVTGDLIVGNTGVGGMFFDIAPGLNGPIDMPLTTDNGIIGNGFDAIGAAVLDDFGVRWEIGTKLSVGNEGQGTLDLFDSAIITAAETVIGEASTGQGDVTINGVGSLLDAGNLTVGKAGLGTLNVNSRASLRSSISRVGSGVDAGDDTGDGLVTLTGRGTRWSVRDALTVGGAAGESHGKIEIQNEALLQIDGLATSASGTMTINPRGIVDLAGGTVRMLPQGTNLITNNGVIRGHGFIDGGMTIGTSGELRNAGAEVQNGATVVRQREHLIVAEVVTNSGLIESLGGEMEFEQQVTNAAAGEIVARDAVMRFRAGDAGTLTPDLVNDGTFTLGGDSTIYGDISTGATGSLFVLSDSEVTVIGDITFSAGAILSLTAGEDGGTLDISGTADVDNAIIALDYASNMASSPGDSYQILQAEDGILSAGSFPRVASADGRLWDIDLVGTDTLVATATAAAAVVIGADFNGDGVVNSLDLMIWSDNYGSMGAPGSLAALGDADGDGDVDGADYFKLLGDFGGAPSPLAGAVAAVPEPSTLAMVLMTAVCCLGRRAHR